MDRMSREIDSAVYDPTNANCIFKIDDRDFYGKEASIFTFNSLSPLMPGLSSISYYVEEKNGKLTLYKKMGSSLKPVNAGEGSRL